MIRIPQAELEQLKQQVSVAKLAEARGVKLTGSGEELRGLCPFHDDTSPSLVINQVKNVWNCLGACAAGGSVIDWVMKAEGVSFRHAVEILRAGAPVTATDKVLKRASVPKLPSPVTTELEDQEVLDQVAAYYHETLKRSPEALAYLETRGLVSSEIIGKFKLGYANRTLGLRLPKSSCDDGIKVRGQLQKLGIMRESGHELMAGSLVIPVHDERGHVVGMYGRKILRGQRQGSPLHMYLSGPHRGVWNVEVLQASKRVILAESLIDALTWWVAGFRNVTTSYGVNGFTDEHLGAFKKYGTDQVVIAYDADDAGDTAANTLAKRLIDEGISVYRVEFPKGMDANEYALKVKPASKSLELVLRKARWVGGKEPARPISEDAIEIVVEAGAPQDEPPALVPPTASPPAVESEPPLVSALELTEEQAAPVGLTTTEEVPPVESATGLNVQESPAPPASPTTDRAQQAPLPPQPNPLVAQLLATPAPAPVASEIAPLVTAEQVVVRIGERRYRVRGLQRNTSFDVLKVNLHVARGESFYVDTLDMYSARQRAAFTKQAAIDLCVNEDTVKKDIGKVLVALEGLQDETIRRAMEPKEKAVVISEADKAAALDFLKDPNLLTRILKDFERVGVVGEETNKLTGYLAATSRKLKDPLAIMIQSSSAAGKSSLMEAVLAFMPEEDRVKYSAMTGQALYYMGETELKNKILALVEEEGAERAAYALKLLQSEGELTIASTGKDPETGRLETKEYHVEGPVMIFVTTTAIELDEEMLNRCIVLTVDESRGQTQAIHREQRRQETVEGLWSDEERVRIRNVHQNAQRLLRSLAVHNPYAEQLAFPDDKTRMRRDHKKYIVLIRAVALLHQYQRQVLTRTSEHGEVREYVEVTAEDISMANKLCNEVLGRTLDELPPQTRTLLMMVEEMVMEACTRLKVERADLRFSRRDVREYTGWGNTQLKMHLHRLEEHEYLIVHKGGRGQSMVYELFYDGGGKDGVPFLCGLVDVGEKKSGSLGNKSGSSRPQAGGGSVEGRGPQFRERANGHATLASKLATGAEILHMGNGREPQHTHNGER
jgi:DNA primase catalytic core